MGLRGQLTEEINARAIELLQRPITQMELRLMPYLMHCAMDGRNIDPRKITGEERAILSEWRKAGWIEGGASDFRMTHEFWDVCCELVWAGYCCAD